MNSFWEKIKKEFPGVKRNIELAPYTSFKIGGYANGLLEIKTRDSLISAVLAARNFGLPFFILGGGSNVLFSDSGYDGFVLVVKRGNLRIECSTEDKVGVVYAEAGVSLSKLVNEAYKNGLTGLEWAIGIPGTVGGAVRGNAGAFGLSIGDIIKEVEVFDIDIDEIRNLKRKDCKFAYRSSIFKNNKNLIILSVVLVLRNEDRLRIKKGMDNNLNYRKITQPLNFPSSGSIFKNPRGVSAGFLIEKCGLKGKRIGQVKFSDVHANFIVNLGEGKAKDVMKLIIIAKKLVSDRFNVKLEEEIKIIGNF